MTEAGLHELFDRMLAARFNLQEEFCGGAATTEQYLRVESYVPHPGDHPALLDAWADYKIAKARYERALLASRKRKV